jgi:thioredoxin
MPTVDLTADTFDRTVRENPIVLVDFWAGWCVPCRLFEPVYDTAAARHDGIVFGKLDTDAHQELALRLGISSIPTLKAYRDGIEVKSVTDALPPSVLETFIAEVRSLDMDAVRGARAGQQDPGTA